MTVEFPKEDRMTFGYWTSNSDSGVGVEFTRSCGDYFSFGRAFFGLILSDFEEVRKRLPLIIPIDQLSIGINLRV
jgi:hypothetical protein